MQKILLIIKREYFSRVRKKSFLILTFLVPSLFIAMYAAIFFIFKNGDNKIQKFIVLDESGSFKGKLHDKENVTFTFSNEEYGTLKNQVRNKEETFLLYIPADYAEKGNVEIISDKKASFSNIAEIENQLADILQTERLLSNGIDTALINQNKPHISLTTKQFTDNGEQDANIAATYVVGFASSFLIYLSLLIYGTQVMRGIIEEKTNRIIEVIISSVKPFQLMMGKILGIGAVGLTQFLMWIVLTTAISSFAGGFFSQNLSIKKENVINQDAGQKQSVTESPAQEFLKAANTINFPYVIGTFVFYFLGGYLIYSALFAAVGSAVDNETETQQFMFPITLPLIFTFIVGMNVIVNNPDSSLSFWLSMIPLTSPIAMMIRIPFGVPGWELALSMFLLIGGFILTTWVASRIYRVGILMYGKKVSYKELIKWFMYKG